MTDPRQLWPSLGAPCPFACLGLPFGASPEAVERACRRYCRGLGASQPDGRDCSARDRLLCARSICLAYQPGWTREDLCGWICTTCKSLFVTLIADPPPHSVPDTSYHSLFSSSTDGPDSLHVRLFAQSGDTSGEGPSPASPPPILTPSWGPHPPLTSRRRRRRRWRLRDGGGGGENEDGQPQAKKPR